MNNKPTNPQTYVTINEAFDTISQTLDVLHSKQLSLHTTLNALIILLYNNGIINLEDLEEREKFINLLNNKEETK